MNSTKKITTFATYSVVLLQQLNMTYIECIELIKWCLLHIKLLT